MKLSEFEAAVEARLAALERKRGAWQVVDAIAALEEAAQTYAEVVEDPVAASRCRGAAKDLAAWYRA